MRWFDISTNPEARDVLVFRKDSVSSSKVTDVDRLATYVAGSVTGKRVLDLGYANHSGETTSIATETTHDIVKRSAASVVGVDVVDGALTPDDKALYFQGDLFTDNSFRTSVLTRSLDVLFAGNILEHLETPSELFRLFVEMQKTSGTSRMVLLVPNPLWFIGLFDLARHHEVDLSQNVDHVALFYPGAIVEMSERNGCTVESWCYVGRGDMTRSFAPRPRKTQMLWAAGYSLARKRRLPFAYNQLAFEIRC